MKVLVIGPNYKKSKGGMATVIEGIKDDCNFNKQFDINIFSSYIDGNIFIRTLYSIYAYIKFKFCYKKYDLFHIHMASYGSTFRKFLYIKTLKRNNKKVIIHIHGAEFMVFYEKQNTKIQKYILNLLDNADLVIALSDKWKKIFESQFKLKNCVSLNNGINIEKYEKAISSVDKVKESFLVLGRLGKRKGTYDLVDAIENVVKVIPEFKCYIAGDGEIEKFRKIIKEKGLDNNIIILGWVNLDEKVKVLKKVSTVVLPSYNEGLPMAILEGMASGKAIISTRVGAIPEVVGSENGILINSGDVHALSDALIKCSTCIDMLQKMSKNNIIKINSQFSMKVMHQKLSEYYLRFI